MTDLVIEKHFPAPPDLVFDFVTRPERLATWWGPESMHVTEAALDFSAPGPWHSVIVNAEGRRYKMSGEVTRIDPPRSVEFTWGWHDDADIRGPESRVRIDIAGADGGGTAFRLTQSGLADEESRANHRMGWTSSLSKLERQFQRKD